MDNEINRLFEDKELEQASLDELAKKIKKEAVEQEILKHFSEIVLRKTGEPDIVSAWEKYKENKKKSEDNYAI